MKLFQSLLFRILIAIVLGFAVGMIAPEWLSRTFQTFSTLFSGFLGFAIPLIIIGLIAPAIAEFGRGAGKWLGVTAGIAYCSTICAGLYAISAGYLTFPFLLNRGGDLKEVANPEDAGFKPFFEIVIDPAFGVLTALLIAFVLGLGIAVLRSQGKNTLFNVADEFRTVVNLLISSLIIPLLPVYIFTVFATMTADGTLGEIILDMLTIVVLAFVLTALMLICQYTVAGVITRRNPLTSLVGMLPAYATALGTASSAATIPVTTRCAQSIGVSKPVASFVIPLCATIHLAGSTVKITLFALAIMWTTGATISVPALIGFVFLLGIAMIAAPGVPGGAIVTAAALLQSNLGFNESQVALMVAIYIAIDSFGTATNVTGDGAIAMIVDKLAQGRDIVTGRTGRDAEANLAAADGPTAA
ncbi:dicarboxylate/amino acid:cation symporter [Helcobacillus sp. ACRRO]|uniref:dicarboxylate/amino acid:cation symporter n=1 Tax=Helcobacillus sp. ACRRO TaxID=2918202 RepID=UPI001EF5B81A|nr:dicarboxylate/amino acid:cation symporter [Helcobacillus sp. ACRRO]MCG7427295.1 dicarboxylate/amino acid:cation symporter [Helcobacillus sp. ACRRO]